MCASVWQRASHPQMIIQYTDMNLFCNQSLWSWGLFNVWLLLTDSLVSLKRKWCCDEEDIAQQCPVAKIRVCFNAFCSWVDEPFSTKHNSTRLKKTIKNWCKWSFFGLFSLLSVLTVFKRSIISYHTPCTSFSLPPTEPLSLIPANRHAMLSSLVDQLR